MFRRGMTSLAMSGTLLLALAVPAAMADTTGGDNGDLYTADGSFSDGQISVDVNATTGTIDGVAFSALNFNTYTLQVVTCKGKGNKTFPGRIFTQVYGSSPTAVIKIDKRLATATASDTMTATEDIQDSCTGTETLRGFTTSVSLNLHATSGTTTTKSRTQTTLADGSKEIFTNKSDHRDAGGNITLLGTSYSTDFGAIEHSVFTHTIVPPPGH